MSLEELMKSYLFEGQPHKSDIINCIAEMKDMPLPKTCRFNFLLPSIYASFPHRRISKQPSRTLLKEVRRLGLRRPNPSTNRALADSIFNFIQSKGLGHEPKKFKPRRPGLRIQVMSKSHEPAGIDGLSSRDVPSEPVGIGGLSNRDVLITNTRVEKIHADLKKRGELGGRGPFSIPTGTVIPTCVMIVSRSSGAKYAGRKATIEVEQEVMEHSLKSGGIIAGLEGADFTNYIFWNNPLKKPVPTHVDRARRRQSGQLKFTQKLKDIKKGTRVVIASAGVDGISCDAEGWQTFINVYQTNIGLDLYMAISEDHKQWENCGIKWGKDDWLGPVSYRYWTCFKMTELFKDGRLYKQLRDQWIKCGGGRQKLSEGWQMQERLASGRNRSKAKRRRVA